jgi:prepilin signal peptidase PulO-like enzyme (type II secretory pathway)
VGSFLNVLILRHNTGRSLGGRSACFSCNQKLTWWELLPVVSFFCQNGHCRSCGSKISWQYPLVELFTGLLFALTAGLFSESFFLVAYWWLIWSVLIVIAVYDLHRKIIPENFSHTFIVLALLVVPVSHWSGNFGKESWLSHLGAAFVFFMFFALLWGVSGGRWMGFGDVKLAFGIGALLGFSAGLNALFLAFYLGALCGVSLIVVGRLRRHRIGLKTELPFAPFLILGMIIVVFTGLNLLP